MTEKAFSKFRLEFNRDADAVNRKPQLAGEYRHADADAQPIKAAFWAGAAEGTGRPTARGKLTFASLSLSLTAKDAAERTPPQLPNGVDLKVGEAVIWKDLTSKGKNGEAHWYGYAHEGTQIARIDAYEHGNVLLGGVRPYRPKQDNAAIAGDAPDVGG